MVAEKRSPPKLSMIELGDPLSNSGTSEVDTIGKERRSSNVDMFGDDIDDRRNLAARFHLHSGGAKPQWPKQRSAEPVPCSLDNATLRPAPKEDFRPTTEPSFGNPGQEPTDHRVGE